MADLTDQQAAQTVKVTGANSSGVESNYVNATQNGDLTVSDGIRSGGVYGNLSLPTANSPVEAKVGMSRLINRKVLTIVPDADMWWGYDNSVTSANGTPIYKDQFISFDLDPNDSNTQVWLVCAQPNKNARITEAP